MNPVLYRLGPFKFEAIGIAPSETRQADAMVWAEVPRIGDAPALQFIGKAAQTITMTGRIYPEFDLRHPNLALFENMNDSRLKAYGMRPYTETPMALTTATGENLGRWVVVRIERTGRALMSNARPRAIDFTIELKRYD